MEKRASSWSSSSSDEGDTYPRRRAGADRTKRTRFLSRAHLIPIFPVSADESKSSVEKVPSDHGEAGATSKHSLRRTETKDDDADDDDDDTGEDDDGDNGGNRHVGRLRRSFRVVVDHFRRCMRAYVVLIAALFGGFYAHVVARAFPLHAGGGPAGTNGTGGPPLHSSRGWTKGGNRAGMIFPPRHALHPDVLGWMNAAHLLVLPGHLMLRLTMFLAEGILVSFFVKTAMERQMTDVLRLLVVVLAVIVVTTFLFTCVLMSFLVMFHDRIVPEMRAIMTFVPWGDPAEVQRIRSLTDKHHFMFAFIVSSLVRNILDWNALRLISSEMVHYIRFTPHQYDDPEEAVGWMSDGPAVVRNLNPTPSTIGMVLLALLICFALKSADRHIPLLKRFVDEVATIWLKIGHWSIQVSGVVAFSTFARRLLTEPIPNSTAIVPEQTPYLFWVPSGCCLAIAIVVLVPVEVFLRVRKSKFRDSSAYLRLVAIALIYPGARTTFAILIAIMTQSSALGASQSTAFVMLLWASIGQPLSIACSMFISTAFLWALEIPVTLDLLSKHYLTAFVAGIGETQAMDKLYAMRAAIGIIDETCLCTDISPSSRSLGAAAVATRLDLVVHILEMMVAWALAQLVQHVYHQVSGGGGVPLQRAKRKSSRKSSRGRSKERRSRRQQQQDRELRVLYKTESKKFLASRTNLAD